MKNVLKKLIAVVLVVTTLTMLFCISSNASQIYHKVVGSYDLDIYMYTNGTNNTTPYLITSLKIGSLSVYEIAVFDCGIVGYDSVTDELYNGLSSVLNSYNNKIFIENEVGVAESTSWTYTSVSETNLNATLGGIAYVAGNKSSSYSSTYCYRLVEIDPVTLMPVHTSYFSNISGNYEVSTWN